MALPSLLPNPKAGGYDMCHFRKLQVLCPACDKREGKGDSVCPQAQQGQSAKRTEGKKATAGPFELCPALQMLSFVCSTHVPQLLLFLAHRSIGDPGLTELRVWWAIRQGHYPNLVSVPTQQQDSLRRGPVSQVLNNTWK